MCKASLSGWKAVVLDLDETLLHSDGSISEHTLRVLQKCKARGIYVVIATASIRRLRY